MSLALVTILFILTALPIPLSFAWVASANSRPLRYWLIPFICVALVHAGFLYSNPRYVWYQLLIENRDFDGAPIEDLFTMILRWAFIASSVSVLVAPLAKPLAKCLRKKV